MSEKQLQILKENSGLFEHLCKCKLGFADKIPEETDFKITNGNKFFIYRPDIVKINGKFVENNVDFCIFENDTTE